MLLKLCCAYYVIDDNLSSHPLSNQRPLLSAFPKLRNHPGSPPTRARYIMLCERVNAMPFGTWHINARSPVSSSLNPLGIWAIFGSQTNLIMKTKSIGLRTLVNSGNVVGNFPWTVNTNVETTHSLKDRSGFVLYKFRLTFCSRTQRILTT